MSVPCVTLPACWALQCLAPTFTGQFHLRGAELRKSGLNRIGNMLVPNSNYCKFEDWVMPILEAMLREQQQQGTLWTPSKVSSALCWEAPIQHRGWAGWF